MANAHAKPHHDYHLVNPSPWPAVGADLGFRRGRRRHPVDAPDGPYAPLVLGAGAIGIAYTMVGWWRDVIHEAELEGDHTRVVQISHRYGMILFIASEVMFFVAWFWAYFNTALFPDDRHVRSLALPAAEHADPAYLGHDGDLGASLASGKRSQGPGLGFGADYRVRPELHVRAGMGIHARVVSLFGQHLRRHILHGDGIPRRPCHHWLDISDRLPVPCHGRTIQADAASGFEFAAWYWHFVDVVWLFLFACIYVWGGGPQRADSRALIAATAGVSRNGNRLARRVGSRNPRS